MAIHLDPPAAATESGSQRRLTVALRAAALGACIIVVGARLQSLPAMSSHGGSIFALTAAQRAPSSGRNVAPTPPTNPRASSPAASRTALSKTAADSLNLVIAATTDIHGRLRGWDYYTNNADSLRGLSRVATIVDSVRRANPSRVVLVDAGDLLQGNPLADVAARVQRQPVHPLVAAMNLMRYDAAAVGNHEFNFGVPFLDAAVRQARFPFLAANVRNANGTPHFAASTTVTRAGVRIAIVGATTPGSMVWDRDNLRAARLTVTDIVPAVRTAVAQARANGADVVIALLHSGLDGASSYDTLSTGVPSENVAARVAREIPELDVVVFGHSHSELVDTTINGALVMQPKNWATTVGVATLSLVKQGGKWRVIRHHAVSVAAAGHAESPEILKLSEPAHVATVKWANSPVGHTSVTWRADSSRVQDSPIVDLVAEVMRREAKADLGTTASFSLDARLDSGAITIAQLSKLYPYENTLRAVRISGAQLRAFLEYSARYFRTLNADGSAPANGIVDTSIPGFNYEMLTGADYVIDLRKPIGQRITSLQFHGKPVLDADSFTLATNNYRQSGGGGYAMLANLPVTYERDVDIRGLLIAEAQRAGELDPAQYFTRNWHIEPASALPLLYAQQNRSRSIESRGGAEAIGTARAGTDTAGSKRVPTAGSKRVPTAGSKRVPTAASSANAGQPPAGRTLRVLTTSDFHAGLEGRADSQGRVRGGAVALEQALVKARGECTNPCTSITIDGGDLFMGSPASDWAAGRPTIAAYNRLGISAGALGNHEFDFGQDTLRMRLRELGYRVLAANVVGSDGKVPAWLRADTIVLREGLRIGIVGAASPFTPTLTKRRNVTGLKFLDPAPIVSARVKALRAQGVDAVIVTIHDGARCTTGLSEGCQGTGIEFVRALTEQPDAVVLAHAHTNMVLTINGIPTVQVSSNGRGMGVIDIPLNPRGPGTPRVRDVIGDSLAPTDAVLDTIVRNAVSRVRTRLEQPVATMSEALQRRGDQYPLGNLVADGMRVIGNADFGAYNNGGIRADVRAGALNFGAVHEVAPFGNVLARLSVRGRDLRVMLESFVSGRGPDAHVSGLQIVYDPGNAPGQRIVSLKKSDGTALEPNKVYTIAVNDFMIDDTQFSLPGRIISTQLQTTDAGSAIAEYLRRLPQPVIAPAEVRIRAVGDNR